MATFEELEDAFTAINRKAPSTAHSLILQELATRSQNGVISDDQAYAYGISQATGTTSVAAMTYQFFTGKTATAAGFDYLVNSTTNTNDLNDPTYQNFNTENRYINFAVNLGVAGEGRAIFSQIYNPLSFIETVAVAYNRIIGASQAAEAGIDVDAAIANIAGRKAYFDAVVAQAGIAAADRDLAAKAAVVGYIMAEAAKSGVGAYAQGLKGFYGDLADDGKANFNVDLNTYIVATSPPGNTVAMQLDASYEVGAVGAAGKFSNNADTATGAINAATVNVAVNTGNGFDKIGASDNFATITAAANLTATVELGGGNDTAWLTLTEAAGKISLDGGVGADTLTLKLASDLATTEVEGFETVTITDDKVGDWDVDFEQFSDVKTLNVNATAGRVLAIDNIGEGIAVSVGGAGDAELTYDDVDTAAITVSASTGGIFIDGVEDTVTITAAKSLTIGGIESSSEELILKGNFSVNLGLVKLGGDERKLDLTAATTKDVAVQYEAFVDTENSVLMGGGDDALQLRLASKENNTITLGAGDDTVSLAGGANIGAYSSGALKTVSRITDFSEGDSIVMTNLVGAAVGTHEVLAAGIFTGVAETDQAYFGVVSAALNGGTFTAWDFAVFEAADDSGVFVYSAGATNAAGDDFYIKLVGVSMDDLDIDGDTITHG